MTKLLEQAFEMASQLPPLDQDQLAKRLMEELEAEKKWDRLFAESEEVLGKMAQEALEERAQGKTKPLNVDEL